MRPRARLIAALAGLFVVLAALSTPRIPGDSVEYVVMALNLGRGQAPSLSPDDLRRAAERYPGDAGARLAVPEFIGADDRQDLPHFWLYPLAAAPFVRLATAAGLDPIRGFTALNVLLLALASIVLSARQPAPVTAFIAAGPILWWIDKAQPEVFTFSLLTIAIALLDAAPWWSAVALGLAAAQNPPLDPAMALTIAAGFAAFGLRERRVWAAAGAGFALAALHPLYYKWRLGMWSPLRFGFDPHWPDLREIVTPAIDPNLGIFVHDAPLTLALAAAAVLLVSDPRRSSRPLARDGRIVSLALAVVVVATVTQMANVNHGGTPGPSRYGLWLIPLTIPMLAACAQSTWMRALAAASVVWCIVAFAPQRAEQYVSPSWLASTLWERWPGIDNPVAEVFGERAGGREPSPQPPIVARACRKALVEGDGNERVVLSQCYARPILTIPEECRPPGMYCYANRDGASWRFVFAPTTPYWRTSMAREKPPADRPAVSLETGWSFAEHLPATRTQPAMTWQWMAERAEVRAVAPAAMQASARLQVRAYGKPRRLRISTTDGPIAEFTVAETPQWYETRPFALAAGTTTFVLESLDGADRGPDAPGSETRRLGFAVFRFEIVSVPR